MDNGKSRDDGSVESAIDTAIDLIGFGKFNMKIVAIGALLNLNGGLSVTNIALITPSAACDFNLKTIDRGVMSAFPMIGMVIGSYFWGCCADIAGRKSTLVTVLFLQGLFEALSALISNYWGYLILKFLSGFAYSGQVLTATTYVGEFHSSKIRQKTIASVKIAWPFGIILSRVIAWIIIPLDISYSSNYFFFRSWNLLVIVYALLAPILAVFIMTLPETPKYLAEIGDDDELVKTFSRMYTQNTGKSFDEFFEKLRSLGLTDIFLASRSQSNSELRKLLSKYGKIRSVCGNVYCKTLHLFKREFFRKTGIIVPLMYCLGSVYFSLSLWFPELFRRFSVFQQNLRNESTPFCGIVERSFSVESSKNEIECPAKIPSDVYSNALMISATSLPVYIAIALLVDKLGARFLSVVATIIALSSIIGLVFVTSSTENVIVSAIYEGFTTISISVVLNIIVDLYPTSIRTMASGLAQLMIRIGAIVGNILMGDLIDHNCFPYMMAIMAQLLICVMLTLALQRV